MDFTQAEMLFRDIEGKYRQGEIDTETYHRLLGQIRVRDAEGRTWMLQEGTGKWYVWDGSQWRAATPPGHTPQSPTANVSTPSPSPATAAPRVTAPPQPQERPVQMATGMSQGINVFGFVWRLVLLAGLWTAITIGLANNQDTSPEAFWAWGALGLFFLAIMLWQLLPAYEGVIEDIRVERETSTDEDGETVTQNVTYAYIRTTDGKIKKTKARRRFQRGDLVYKRKGDWSPRKVKN